MATTVSFTDRELRRLDIINRLIRDQINGTQASQLLHLSTRQVRRLKAGVLRNGPQAIAHGGRGKASNFRISNDERGLIVSLIKEYYHDFGPTLAAEKLAERHKVAIENHDLKTQFQRAMIELRIEPIFANSPQAKGRVERLFGTLQDRLVKELRLQNISDIETANKFLQKKFIPDFNRRFAVKPRHRANLHKPLSEKEKQQIDTILSRQTRRTVQNDFTISFNNQWHQILPNQPVTVCKQDEIIIEERLDGTIHFRLRGKYLNTKPIPKFAEQIYRRKRQPWIIAANKSANPPFAK